MNYLNSKNVLAMVLIFFVVLVVSIGLLFFSSRTDIATDLEDLPVNYYNN